METSPFRRDELTRPGTPSYRLARSVRLQDVDAAGVVFFAAAFEMFSDAFLAWCAAVEWPITRMFGPERIALPIRHAEAHYLAPLRLGDPLGILVVGCRASSDELRIGFRIEVEVPEGERSIAAVGQTLHVCVETGEFTRRDLPDDLRSRLTAAPRG